MVAAMIVASNTPLETSRPNMQRPPIHRAQGPQDTDLAQPARTARAMPERPVAAIPTELGRSALFHRHAAACWSFGVGTERVMRVSADGQMTLTVIPLDAFSIATMRANATIPSFAAP